MLAEYLELGQLIRRREELRTAILNLLEARRPVEAGPLTALVRRGARHRLTTAGLKALVGEENFQVFMAEIAPVPYRELVVGEDG